MKYEIKEGKPEGFEPINVTLVIESEEELANLLMRLYIPAYEINKAHAYSLDRSSEVKADDSTGKLWDKLDDIARARHLFDY